MDNENDLVSMTIIANSGDARSFAFKALEEAKAGNFEEAEELLSKSNKAANLAHKAQTELLFKEANGDRQDINVLLVHSQDHLMTSMLASELIKEIILLYKNK
jgi:cellobiose PTS system EIIA component